jgi:nicotinate-nucleotide--dimethylbenzimidazole phosphoribosyltransferase
MNRKGRPRRSKIPVSVASARLGRVGQGSVAPAPEDQSAGLSVQDDAATWAASASQSAEEEHDVPSAREEDSVAASAPDEIASPVTAPREDGPSARGSRASTENEVTASAGPHGDMVAPQSSPASVRPRPQAPSLHFVATPHPSQVAPGPAEPEVAARQDDSDPDPDREEGSFPPVDLDARFFEAALAAHGDFDLNETEHRDLHRARKLSPVAVQRRAHLTRYVTIAVGLSSALCVAALVKIAVARSHDDPRPRSSWGGQAAAAAPLNARPTTVPATASAPAAANSAAVDTAATQPAPQVVPVPPPATAEPPPRAAAEPPSRPTETPPQPLPGAAAAEAPSPTADLDPKEAAKEKAKSRRALESGRYGDAILAGERSVAIDPTDAEAWLLLGASYQQKGDSKNAVRSFRSCVDQGKRGPKYDCAAMLR